ELWLGNNLHNRRTERGTFFPPFWKMDSHYSLVEFSTELNLAEQETITICAEGRYNVKLDGKFYPGMPDNVLLPAGKHSLNIKVFCLDRVPALYVQGKTVATGPQWKATFEDKEWIDASGRTSGKSGTIYRHAGSWNFDTPSALPSAYKLPVSPMAAVSMEPKGIGMLVDFGKETMGFPLFQGVEGKGWIRIYYGESAEEAADTLHCETTDRIQVTASVAKLQVNDSKAYRYLYIETDGGVTFKQISMLYEFAPVTERGSFRCSDTLLNRIWDVSDYTLHLTTREFFIDGIKRDRWVWSGDAYQSYLMNYYLFFDAPTVERTIQLLRGKDPVTSHINTIMDYTFYWFLSLSDYYLYTGDKTFIEQLYPRMESMMQFVLSRRNSRGLLEGLPGDWVFIDWTDKEMSKQGEVSFEQLLYCRSLETMAECAGLVGKPADQARYEALAASVKHILLNEFWDQSRQAFVHNKVNGQSDGVVTRYTNMFAIFFNYLTDKQKEAVKTHVILNDSIMKISTPYMRFYELEAMCTMGETDYVLNEMRHYWGGMLKAGATSFWEKYNPEETGVQHLAMYQRPYGKSLCHAWGASPVYLLGKYFLGVKPVAPGYSKFEIRPELGDLNWLKGSVPTPNGQIKVYANARTIKVSASEGEGYLYFKAAKKPKASTGMIEKMASGDYRLLVKGDGREIVVTR
ncbi:MAG: alpha-L-rhamnosidase C-terminal domain-containing protein, partial [Bacteroidota bacterium]|nr:alpha-L-rhamnosidase C-terminal domain-containing protein [Bacteroidota bacterium]